MTAAIDLAAFLAQAGVFGGLDKAVTGTIVAAGRRRSFPPGAALMTQGETAHSLHVVVSGSVRVERRLANGTRMVLAEIGPGEAVGEMGLLTAQPRTADVSAIGRTDTIELDRAAFEEIGERFPKVYALLSRILSRRLAATNDLLTSGAAGLEPPPPISGPLHDAEPAAVAALLERGTRVSFAAGTALMRQGEPSTQLFFIVSGLVRVERSSAQLTSPVAMAELGPGDFAGETGVFTGAPRSSTLVALEDTVAIEIVVKDVFETLARFPDIWFRVLRTVGERLREGTVAQGLVLNT